MDVRTPASMNCHPRRIRLKPWLIAQVDSGQYMGLQWENQERKLFRIPWRHATRHIPIQDDENTIFKAWAKETGKYQEGVDEPDPAKWKANLRCALNKSREFKLLYDGTKETPMQPFKIYEVCEIQQTNGDSFAGDEYICGQEDDEELQQMLPNLRLIDNPPPYTYTKQEVQFGISCCNGPFPSESLPPNMAAVAPTTAPPLNLAGDKHPSQNLVGPPRHIPLTELIPLGPIESIPDVNIPLVNAPQFIPDLLISPHMLPLTDLEIKFLYRGRTAGSLTVSNPHGCRLFYSTLEPTPDQVELFGPMTLEQVRFPSTDNIPNDKQRFYTNHLLDVMDRGLILELQGQDIYAIRLCQCKVFWSGPCAGERLGPNPIERETRIKLFSLESFLNELIMCQKGQTRTTPPYEIFFCFGEDWPDKKPKEKKLITVQVIPVAARILLEIFSGEANSSIDSIRLQISHPDMKDKMVEQFKELHQLWQNQQAMHAAAAPPGLEAVQGPETGAGPWPMQ
ncbi:interferon regulatory factor 5 [Lissotriton helveticus]